MTMTELAELRADAEAVLANSDNHWWQRSVPNGGYDKACRLARAFLAAQPLAWSDAKPTVPGWHWWKDSHWEEPIHVIELDGRLGVPGYEIGDLDPIPDGQFAGPIPMPVEDEQ